MDTIFSSTIRVRYAETDAMGVVYHANYLIWFEVAREEMFQVIGLNYAHLEKRGLYMPVISADLKYKKPAKYGDIVTIATNIKRLTPVRALLCYDVFNEDKELLVQANTEHVFVNRDLKPIRCDKCFPLVWDSLGSHFQGNNIK